MDQFSSSIFISYIIFSWKYKIGVKYLFCFLKRNIEVSPIQIILYNQAYVHRLSGFAEKLNEIRRLTKFKDYLTTQIQWKF